MVDSVVFGIFGLGVVIGRCFGFRINDFYLF